LASSNRLENGDLLYNAGNAETL